MNVFVCDKIQGQKAFLKAEEAFHCFKVLRKVPGDKINLIDGKGNFYESMILEISKNHCETEITNIWQEEKRNYYLHLAVAPTKNISRFEWFLEKATEIGIDEITPVICQHSERKKINENRLNKIIISAVKQSLSAKFPILNPLTPIDEIISNPEHDYNIYAHLQEDTKHIKKLVSPESKICIVVGPEGDFSSNELQFFKQNNWQAGILGKKRLRTETAALVACQIINGIHF